MDKNKIIISADADTKEAIKKITELEKKLKSLREIGVAKNPQDFNVEQRSKKFEEFKQRAQADYNREIQKTQKSLEKNLDQLYVKEKALHNLREKQLIKETTYAERKLQINTEILEIEQKIAGVASADRGSKLTPTSALKGIGSVTSALLSIGKAADFVNRQVPMYRAERSSSLAEKTYESSYQAMRGDSFRNLMFAQERQTALKDTGLFGQSQIDINRGTAGIQGIGGTALVLGGLAALLTGGAALPALLGAGAVAGGAGLLSARQGAGYDFMTGNMGEIDKMTGIQMMDYFKKRSAAEEAKDMQKTLIKDFLTENRESIVTGLRQSGMSEKDFFKNIQGTSQDFLFSDKMRMSQQILGAGGGSEAAFGKNMELALQLQRSMGVSNAGQLIGSLSSYRGAEGGAQAFEEMMARGVTIGLDKSKYREEHRTYLTQVTEMARQIAGGESVISASVLAGMGDNITQRGVEIASEQTKNLFDTLSQSGGVIGAMKMRGIASSDTFKNIQGIDRVLMSRMRMEDIEAGNPELDYFYEKAGGKEGLGKSKEDFAKELRKLYTRSEIGAYSATKEGKELLDIYDKIEQGTATEAERRRGSQLYSFFSDTMGSSAKKDARFRAASGMENFFSTEAAEKQQQAYEGLKLEDYNNLTKEQQEKYQEYKKTYAGRRDRPEGFMEGTLAGNAIAQNQTIDSEKLGEVMAELAKSTTERLNMALVDRLNLEGFNRALQAGATQAMEELVAVIAGRSRQQYLKGVDPRSGDKLNLQSNQSKPNYTPSQIGKK